MKLENQFSINFLFIHMVLCFSIKTISPTLILNIENRIENKQSYILFVNETKMNKTKINEHISLEANWDFSNGEIERNAHKEYC